MDTAQPRIKVTKDGPYEVTGDIALTPKRMVLSENGEPLTWSTGPPIPHATPFWLCRCGHSDHKPFCDGSHEKVGFDGTETATEKSFAEMEKVYDGVGMRVHRVGSICQHASFCANAITDWYQMLPDTADITVKGRVIDMVEHCPSGALVLELDGEIIEPDYVTAISPVEDGPYWVTGGVPIERSDEVTLEVRNRVTLCRCGESKNKPLCDGTHKECGFVAKVMVDEDPALHRPEEKVPSRRIVVAVVGSTGSPTFEVASMIKSALPATMEFVHVGEDNEVLLTASEKVRAAGIDADDVSFDQRRGSGTAALLNQMAIDADADLLILDRGGERVGHVAHRLSYHSPCDVLLVDSARPDRPERYRRVLIATDGSATADRAAKRGYGLARALDCSVDLVFVGHPETGELIVDDTIHQFGSGVETDSWMLRGDPADQILQTAEKTNADLIVVGNKGMTRTRMLLGASVPGAVLKKARTDLLLCRTVRQLESELEPGEGGIIERDGESLAAYVDETGELRLMSARCTHMGCVVGWNPGEGIFECPCHGSAFSPLGEVVRGPANRALHAVE
jgi:CDGSH-type Zn-finger protein/nitrite reductase/ring-hydroxylating ferredoxin subunit